MCSALYLPTTIAIAVKSTQLYFANEKWTQTLGMHVEKNKFITHEKRKKNFYTSRILLAARLTQKRHGAHILHTYIHC